MSHICAVQSSLAEMAPMPILLFENQQSWEAWLEEHHNESKGVWLKIAKDQTSGRLC
jgi:uncharacterized protein YdeI (YjbR/CyaY-like superfamily)